MIALDVDSVENEPIFWMVNYILYIEDSWILLLQKLTCSNEPHYKTYIVLERLPEYICMHPHSLLHPPLEVFLLAGYQAFSLRHVIRK